MARYVLFLPKEYKYYSSPCMCVEVYSSAETAAVLGRGFQGSRVREEIPRGLAACKTLGIPRA